MVSRTLTLTLTLTQVVEIAPAWNLSPELRKNMQDDALRLVKGAKYLNAGTVELLVANPNPKPNPDPNPNRP